LRRGHRQSGYPRERGSIDHEAQLNAPVEFVYLAEVAAVIYSRERSHCEKQGDPSQLWPELWQHR
jgi:hypothetical protein